MGRFFRSPYSEKLIQSTLDYFGPLYAQRGEQLTRTDAEETYNLGNFFDGLWEIDQAQRKRTIESYYREKGVEVVGFLAEDLQTDNLRALQHVEYAIDHLTGVPGLDELLRDLAWSIKRLWHAPRPEHPSSTSSATPFVGR